MRPGLLAALAPALVAVAAAASSSPATAHADAGTNTRLVRYYRDADHYRAVKREVLEWHGTTSRACVAFASTALRHIGIDIPEDGVLDGHGVSRITLAFSRWLEEELGWSRVDDALALRPGDVVFTADDPCCEGYPEHVFVFESWRRRKARVANVLDNQGFTHARPLDGDAGDEISAFAYALRAPDEP